MKFGYMILRKIIKFVATKCQILRLNAPNSISAGDPLRTPLGELTAFRQTQLDLRGSTYKGEEGKR